MAKNSKKLSAETDSIYFLKLVIYIILGSFWLKFDPGLQLGGFVLYGVPLGLMIGLIVAYHDHFQVDRKIEYATLVVVTILSFYVPSGIVI